MPRSLAWLLCSGQVLYLDCDLWANIAHTTRCAIDSSDAHPHRALSCEQLKLFRSAMEWKCEWEWGSDFKSNRMRAECGEQVQLLTSVRWANKQHRI